MSNQHYFDVPFAFSGDVTAIPDPLQTGGTVSFTEGWNYNYQRNLSTDPAALPIDRSTMNWLLLQITTALQALQKETIPEFVTASQNGGTAIAYNPQATVLWSASGNAPFTKFVNILGTANSNTPSASDVLGTTTGWQVSCDPIATAAQATAGTNNASIMTPLLVAQQTALRALLAGNSSQVFNVATATASTHAVPLAQMQAAQMQYKVLGAYSSSQTLTAASTNPCQGGRVFFTGSTASQTLTLPAFSTMTSNATEAFTNDATVSVTLACQGTDTITIAGTTVTSIVLQPGDDIELTNGSSGYYAAFGSTLRQYNPLIVAAATAGSHAVRLSQMQAAQMQYKVLGAYSANSVLTAASTNPCQGGASFFTGSTASQTLTLPVYSTMTSNATETFTNVATVAVTLACQGTDTITIAGTTKTSIVLQPGDDIELTNGSGGYYATSGSALRQFNPLTVANAVSSQQAVAMGQLYGGLKGINKFASTGGTFVVPAGVTTIYATGAASGGGGGGGFSTTGQTSLVGGGGGGGGGAGQQLVRQAYTVTPGSTITVTIGAAGTAGSGGVSGGAVPTAGGTGGNLVISGTGFNGGTSVTLTGGTGGAIGGSVSSNAIGGGGAGGAGGAGFPNGGYGTDGNYTGNGGTGASGPFGGGGYGGRAVINAQGTAGGAAGGNGAGGGGGGGAYGTSAQNGGNGGVGTIGAMIFEW